MANKTWYGEFHVGAYVSLPENSTKEEIAEAIAEEINNQLCLWEAFNDDIVNIQEKPHLTF